VRVPGHIRPTCTPLFIPRHCAQFHCLPQLHKTVHTIPAALLTFTRKPIYVDCTFHNYTKPSVAAQWTGSQAGGPGSRPRLCRQLVMFVCSFTLTPGSVRKESGNCLYNCHEVPNTNSVPWGCQSQDANNVISFCVTVAASRMLKGLSTN
jgi:hypothetical protein